MADLLSLNKTYTKDPEAHASFPDEGGITLTDGVIGPSAHDSKYCAWNYGHPVITINLGKKCKISYVRFHYLYDVSLGIYGPDTLEVKGSNNNVDFTSLDSFVKVTDWATTDETALWSNNLTTTGNWRYIQFNFTDGGEWSPYLSELEVYGDPLAVGGFSGTHTANWLFLKDMWEKHNKIWRPNKKILIPQGI